MRSNWAAWSIKHKQVIYFFAVLLTIMGLFSYFTLGRQEDPGFTVKQMVISAAWPGATAKQMEWQVTDKIEKIAQTVPDIDHITSYSRPGSCVVNVYVKENLSAAETRQRWQEVRNLINDGKNALPAELYGPYYNDHFDDVFGNVYAVTGDGYSYEDMRKEASRIKDRFVLIRDVKKVELLGVQPEKIYIQPDNAKLSQLGMSIEQLASVIQAETAVTPAPMKHSTEQNIYLRLTGLPDTVKNIENLPVSGNGRTLRLGDIAAVKRDYAEPAEPKMYFNGKPAIGIAVSMIDGGDNLKLGSNLEKEVQKMQKELPLGFELHQVLNQPQVVENAIGEFMKSLAEAILIVLAVSLMTLGRQSGYVISVCIPLVLMCSMVGMYLWGIDLHKISLGSLIVSLGMLVDDAVVVVEMIESKINEGWDRLKACSYAFESCAKPLLTGTLITCVSFMPIAFAQSSVGEYAGSLFVVITVTLMSSWLIASTIAPALAHSWIKPASAIPEHTGTGFSPVPPERTVPDSETLSASVTTGEANTKAASKNPLYEKEFYKFFRKILNWSLAHRLTVIVATLAIFASSLLLARALKQEFFPASVRPELLVELNLPEGSSLRASDEAAQKLTGLIMQEEGVASISTYVGKSSPRFVLVIDPVLPRDNYAQLVVVAKDAENRKQLEKKITKLVEEQLPNVQSYSRSIPLGPPTPYPVMIRVSAPTDGEAKRAAEKLKQIMLNNKNVTVIRYDWMEKSPSVKVELDDDKLRQMGLTRKSVSSALYAEISGYTVSQYYEGDQAIDLVFRLEPRDHSNISDLGTLSIPTARGAVPLSQVASLSYENEDGMIWRRNLLPTITVNAGITEGSTGNDVSREIMEAVKKNRQQFPAAVTIEEDGPAEKSKTSLASILSPVPMMLVIMLVLLMLMLKDVKKLTVVICTAPLGLIGVIWGLFLFNTPLGIMAEIGALALIGTIIRNTTVLIDQIDQHLAQGMTPLQAVKESVVVRFRPIMLTALTTVLGLLPMFPSDFWRGLAIAISCGLTAATLITLLVMPTLYCLVFQIPNEEKA